MTQTAKFSPEQWSANSYRHQVNMSVTDAISPHERMLKPILVLTTLLFLIVAPEPDSKTISEMTANLLVAENHTVLMAVNKRNESIPNIMANKP